MDRQGIPPYVLALDIGTSGARALLFDRQGQEVTGIGSRQRYEFRVSADGGVEIEADLVLESIFHCLDEATQQLRKDAQQIAGVAACTFVGNVLGIGDHGRAVTPV